MYVFLFVVCGGKSYVKKNGDLAPQINNSDILKNTVVKYYFSSNLGESL